MTENIKPRHDIVEHGTSTSLQIRGGIDEACLKTISDSHFDCITIYAGKYPDLSSLVLVRDKITRIHVGCSDVDWDSLQSLSKAESIMIDTHKCRLNFAKYPKLTDLYLWWCPGFETTLRDLPTLKSLRITGYKHDSLEGLGSLPSLKYLSILRNRRLKNLKGIHNIPQLKLLEIENASELVDIADIVESKSLYALWLSDNKRLRNYESIAGITHLKELLMRGPQNNIRWVEKMKNLEKLTFAGKFEDGDLTFLLAIDNLQMVLFENSKTYSHKLKEIQEIFEARGFDQWDLRAKRLRYGHFKAK